MINLLAEIFIFIENRVEVQPYNENVHGNKI